MYREKKNGETLRSRDTIYVGTNKGWSVFGKGTKYGVVS